MNLIWYDSNTIMFKPLDESIHGVAFDEKRPEVIIIGAREIEAYLEMLPDTGVDKLEEKIHKEIIPSVGYEGMVIITLMSATIYGGGQEAHPVRRTLEYIKKNMEATDES